VEIASRDNLLSDVDQGAEGSNTNLRVLEKVIIVIIVVTLGAGCLLISSAQGYEAGHQPWKPGSVLKIIAEIMALNYEYPTPRGVEIKWLTQGLGAAAVLLAITVGWYVRARRKEEEQFLDSGQSDHDQGSSGKGIFSTIDLATGSQVALFFFACWAMSSALWASWPDATHWEGIRQLTLVIWAIVLGRSLGRKGACGAVLAMVIVLAITAVLGIWYFIERNPYQRLKFPIGNPIFLASCLLPGIILSFTGFWGAVHGVIGRFGNLETDDEQSRQFPSKRPNSWLIIIGAAVAFIAMVWAFQLTDSRGPKIGLIVGSGLGLIMTILMLLTQYVNLSRQWRGAIYAILFAFVLMALIAGLFWFKSQLEVKEYGRGATVRLRLHTWKYAKDLFLQKPLIGHGQGSYMTLAQSMSLGDAENDPAAFPASVLGHAHNEWLQILAELGAIGFALMMVALTMTFGAGIRALGRLRYPMERWCLIGLLSALVAIVVEEASDVALRMPGLPIVFYTVIGLIWGMSRHPKPTEDRQAYFPKRTVRLAGLIGGIAASGCIVGVAWCDWEGARSDHEIIARAEKRQWIAALQNTDAAINRRLVLEYRLSAGLRKTNVAYQAASYELNRIRATFQRFEAKEINQDVLTQIVQADALRCRDYARLCISSGDELLKRILGYPYAAGLVASAFLVEHDLELIEQGLGLKEQNESRLAKIQKQAQKWMEVEFLRDRLNAENGLKLFDLSFDQPLAYRLDLLRIPLRKGPIVDGVEAALATLIQEQGFGPIMEQLLSRAEVTLAAPRDVSWWESPETYDPYAPETFRIGALVARITGRFEQAAKLAAKAAELSEDIRDRFPTAVSHARLDEAGYLLLAQPGNAGLAVDACREAIDQWPHFGDRQERLKPVRKDLSLYLLAAGDEPEARKVVQQLSDGISPEKLKHNIGYGYAELCQRFIVFSADHRPKSFAKWLERSLELAPSFGNSRLMAIQVAFEKGNDQEAKNHLVVLEKILADPQQMWAILQNLSSIFKDNEVLKNYMGDFVSRHTVQTQPAEEMPTTLPTLPGVGES